MSEHFDTELLNSILNAHVPGGDYVFSPTPTGEFSTTYFADSPDRQLVLRIAPPDGTGFVFYEHGMMAQEQGIHNLILKRTSVPVPVILVYDSSRKLLNRDFLIMERLSGTPASQLSFDQSAWSKVLYQVGQYLRQIHGIKTVNYGYLGEHRCMEPQTDWASAFRVVWDKMADDIRATGYYDAEETAYIKGLLTKHSHHFDRPVDSSLLHMDIWSQNILVLGSKVTGLIDFDRACWGDVEMEFAVLDYCQISEPSFWEGYGMERDLSGPAMIRRLFYLLYEVQKYIVIYHWRGKDSSKPLHYKMKSMDMAGEL